MPNEAYQPKSPHFHEDSSEKRLSWTRGATSSSFRGEYFHEISFDDVSCLFNRGSTFSQTVTYNNNVFLPADTIKSIVQTHTFCINAG